MATFAVSTPTFNNPYSYHTYKTLLKELVGQQKTTGDEQTEHKVDITRLNLQRMKRVEKQMVIIPEIKALLEEHQPMWHWVVLTEAWCGDGAQLLPAIAAIAALAPTIKLTVLLRDQNPDWMDTCLTNGSRSVPKLVCMDVAMQDRLFTWGPRPALLHKKYLSYRALHPNLTTEEAAIQVHTWYAKDRSNALQQDLLSLMEQELFYATDELLTLG